MLARLPKLCLDSGLCYALDLNCPPKVSLGGEACSEGAGHWSVTGRYILASSSSLLFVCFLAATLSSLTLFHHELSALEPNDKD